jgi:hypothetical protein
MLTKCYQVYFKTILLSSISSLPVFGDDGTRLHIDESFTGAYEDNEVD